MTCIGFFLPLKGPKVPMTEGKATPSSKMATMESLKVFIVLIACKNRKNEMALFAILLLLFTLLSK